MNFLWVVAVSMWFAFDDWLRRWTWIKALVAGSCGYNPMILKTRRVFSTVLQKLRSSLRASSRTITWATNAWYLTLRKVAISGRTSTSPHSRANDIAFFEDITHSFPLVDELVDIDKSRDSHASIVARRFEMEGLVRINIPDADYASDLAFSPNGKYLATLSRPSL